MGFIHDVGHKTGFKSLFNFDGKEKVKDVIPMEAWSVLARAQELWISEKNNCPLNRPLYPMGYTFSHYHRWFHYTTEFEELANTVRCYTQDVHTNLNWGKWILKHNEGLVKSFDLARKILNEKILPWEPSKDFWIISILSTLCNYVAPHLAILQSRLVSNPLNDGDSLFVKGAKGKPVHS